MSTRPTPLKHPAVVLGVAVGLVAVGLLNLRTFGPELKLFGARHDDRSTHLTPPDDLEDVVRSAVAGRGPGDLALAGDGAAGTLLRDPFTRASSRPQVAPVRTERRTRPRPAVPALECSAVLLGGERPLALIGGESYGPGDRVRDHEILTIDADGVRLRRPDGGELVLAVGPPQTDPPAYHLVTETRNDDDAGQTRLSASRTEEGTER
jgi:hypothetical protein